MKNQDDGTLSLFDDFPPAPTTTTPATPAKAPATKKPRAQRKVAEPLVEETPIPEAAPEIPPVDQGTQVETTLHLAGLVDPQRRRNSPWAKLDIAPVQEAAQVPHVMLVLSLIHI
jgi:hypothetical protein